MIFKFSPAQDDLIFAFVAMKLLYDSMFKCNAQNFLHLDAKSNNNKDDDDK